MDIDLVPVAEAPQAAEAPPVVEESNDAPAPVPSPSAPVPSEASAPKRGRGRPPGARNKPKAKVKANETEERVQEASTSVTESLPVTSMANYEQTRESLLPPKPMTPLELSRHLRELSSARQQEKRAYYGKMLAHLL